MLGVIGLTIVSIMGLASLVGGTDDTAVQTETLAEVLGVQVNPDNYDLGDVPINGGNVSREYEIVNTSDQTIKLKKIVTSCMCTEAKVSIGDRETKLFGMEHPGKPNPVVNLEIPAEKPPK